jgi:hypothetical protein
LGEHGFADPDGTMQDDGFAAFDEREAGQVADGPGGNVRVVSEVEILYGTGGLV